MADYSHIVESNGMAIPTGVRQEVTTTRVRDDIQTTLTNIDTKSDAWGKVIPMGFGRHRCAGALVWASQFYKTTENFEDITTQKSIVSWIDHQDVNEYVKGVPISNSVVNTPFDVVRSSGSQVTRGSIQNASIDLCYSFGIEGDTRKQRYIEKIRINTDTLIYDASASPPFIADGIGFSVRYGYDDAPPALLEKYPNGKFHYPGHTLVIFDKFPLSLFGNSVPNSVDVEWGCCVGAPPIDGCGFQGVDARVIGRDNTDTDRIKAGTIAWAPGVVAAAAICKQSGFANNAWAGDSSWVQAGGTNNAKAAVEIYYRHCKTQAQADAWNAQDIQLVNPYNPNDAIEDRRICGWLFTAQTHLADDNPLFSVSAGAYNPPSTLPQGSAHTPGITCLAVFCFDLDADHQARPYGTFVGGSTTTAIPVQQFYQNFVWDSTDAGTAVDSREFDLEDCSLVMFAKLTLNYKECAVG